MKSNSKTRSSRGKLILKMEEVKLFYSRSRSLLDKDRHCALESVSLELRRGETLGIIGRNGAGKSSILKLLAGILEPDTGSITRYDQNLRISLLSLQLGFQPRLSGRENAILGCLLMGLSNSEANNLLPEIIEFSGLEESIDDSILSYSSGMRARLGFSVAYYTKSDVILIDEILGVGDHEFKLKSREAILSLIQSNSTVVLVSHDEQSLKDVCDSLIWIENGRTALHGSTHEVLELYHDYDHLVKNMASALNITRAEFRRQRGHVGPVLRMEKMRGDLRMERARRIPAQFTTEDSSVRYFYPKRLNSLSNIILEDCGQTVWVEGGLEMLRGDDHQVRMFYQKYEDILASLARISKVEYRQIRDTVIAQELRDTLVAYARSRQRCYHLRNNLDDLLN